MSLPVPGVLPLLYLYFKYCNVNLVSVLIKIILASGYFLVYACICH